MDSYIIRIYRRYENDRLTGIVEDIQAQIETGFNDRDELWKILREGSRRLPRSAAKGGKRRVLQERKSTD